MGSQLSVLPDKKKTDHNGETARLRFCCSEMKGWRPTMEDAHIAEVDLGDGNALFGVFDGHGGPEVAKFVSVHFHKSLVKNTAYKAGDYKRSLQQTFMKMDRML